MPRPIAMPEAPEGRERAASNSGRPIQIGTSHRAPSLKTTAIESASAPSHFPVEDTEVVNRRASAMDSCREEVIEEPQAPVSARKMQWESGVLSKEQLGASSPPAPSEAPKDEPVNSTPTGVSAPPPPAPTTASPPTALAAEHNHADSTNGTESAPTTEDEPWSAVDILTLGVSRLLTPRGSSKQLE